jgi:hypothetical protein
MKNYPAICYLCGKPHEGKFNRDHVPPKQLFAKDLLRKHNPKLFWLPTHEECNKSFQRDEDYFIFTLMPFGRGSYSGDALRRKILDDCKRHEPQGHLLKKVLGEFERNPSGLILPKNMVVKRFNGDRILRVAWKIVRGLYFAHSGISIPENSPKACELVMPGQEPPLSFFYLSENPIHQQYPAVFDYRFRSFFEIHNLHVWSLLLWDRLIVIVKFQFPICHCPECAISESGEAEDLPSN